MKLKLRSTFFLKGQKNYFIKVTIALAQVVQKQCYIQSKDKTLDITKVLIIPQNTSM